MLRRRQLDQRLGVPEHLESPTMSNTPPGRKPPSHPTWQLLTWFPHQCALSCGAGVFFGHVSANLNPAMCLADWVLGNSNVSQFFALSASEVRAFVLTKGVSAALYCQNLDRA